MAEKRKYDSTVARIAGNILSGRTPAVRYIVGESVLSRDDGESVEWAVEMARAVVEEVQRTEPVAARVQVSETEGGE